MGATARRTALVAAVREDIDAEARRTALVAGGARVRDLLNLAAAHRVRSWMIEAVRDCPELGGVPDDQLLDHARAAAVPVHTRSTLGRVAAVLDGAGIDWVVYGGPVLAGHVYERGAMRSYADLDLLVRRRDFATVLDLLVDHGHDEQVDDWDHVAAVGAGGVPLASASATLHLHWSVIDEATTRRAFAMGAEALLGHRRKVRLDTGPVPTLDEVDTLLQLVLHAGLGGANRLVWLKDIDQAVRNQDIDRDELHRRAGAYRMRVMTAFVLARVASVLGTPVGPVPRLASAATVIDRLPRPAHTLADGLYSGLWLANARDDALASVRSVAGSVRGRGGTGGRGARPRPCRSGSGAARGGLARNRYLANVAAGRYGV